VEEFGDYDMVMVDAFVASGIAHTVTALAFFENCATRLSRDGLVSVNLWARDRFGLNDILETIHDGLDRPVWRLPVPDKDNVIALAGRPFTARNNRTLGDRALSLGKQYDLPFANILKTLRKHNPALL
jgi:spermidine synthase